MVTLTYNLNAKQFQKSEIVIFKVRIYSKHSNAKTGDTPFLFNQKNKLWFLSLSLRKQA